MNHEETICELKKQFAKQYSYAELTIRTRTVKGKKNIYFKTVGAYKVESGRLIECYFHDIELTFSDYGTLTYKYRGKL